MDPHSDDQGEGRGNGGVLRALGWPEIRGVEREGTSLGRLSRPPISSWRIVNFNWLRPFRLPQLSMGFDDRLLGLSDLFNSHLFPFLGGFSLSRDLDQIKPEVSRKQKKLSRVENQIQNNLGRWRNPHGLLLQFSSDPSRPHCCVTKLVCHVGVRFKQVW